MELAEGAFVTPNVQLVRLLGTGGMSRVWVADHLGLKTQVAVKFVSRELLAHDPTIIERFNREAALSAQIKSAHVVQIFDHGVTDDGTPFIVMELLEGETLTERVDRLGPLGLGDTAQVLMQTAKALSRAHKLGIVHRDIKPDNLFLVDSEFELYVKVLDFGIAKKEQLPAVSPVTGTGAMVGTPEFMSPEQVLSSKSVDHRADLWALGVVAYYALTGAVPFAGETLGSLCVAIAGGRFLPPSERDSRLPSALDSWFATALAVDPVDRFQSARELASSFVEAAGGTVSHRGADSSRRGSFGSMLRSEWPAEDFSLADAERPTLAQHRGATESEAAQTRPWKMSPTFSGASLATAPPGRRVRPALLGAVGAAALLAVGAVVVLLRGSPQSAPTTPAGSTRSTVRLEPETSARGQTSQPAPAEVASTTAELPDAASPTSEPAATSTSWYHDKPVASGAATQAKSAGTGKLPLPAESSHGTEPTPTATKDRGF